MDEEATGVPKLDLPHDDSHHQFDGDDDGALTTRSTLSDFVRGVGEVPTASAQSQQGQVPSTADSPYLLLDVRESDAYDACHIVGSLNYPTAMLSRSCNYFTKEILAYKNKTGKIIILYDEDERLAPNAATTFVQRDVDNVFMLSGGLRVVSQKFPEGLVSGPLPDSCQPSPPPRSRRSTARQSGSASRLKTASFTSHPKSFSPDGKRLLVVHPSHLAKPSKRFFTIIFLY
eukprot:m.72001 g.72001  ORF g.72001 m.72001 type:complete len:231 (+) comp35768_c0_seq16:485-1177(+)